MNNNGNGKTNRVEVYVDGVKLLDQEVARAEDSEILTSLAGDDVNFEIRTNGLKTKFRVPNGRGERR